MIKGKKKGWDRLHEVEITEEMIYIATRDGEDMGELKNSILKGEGNTGGFLGEEVVKKFLGVSRNNSYNYDILAKNKKFEIKTKRTSDIPEEDYECSVAAYNTQQKCDYYVFVRVTYDLKKAWIVGYLPKEEFYEKARFSPAGSREINGYIENVDCWKVTANQTFDIIELL